MVVSGLRERLGVEGCVAETVHVEAVVYLFYFIYNLHTNSHSAATGGARTCLG